MVSAVMNTRIYNDVCVSWPGTPKY